MYIGNTGSQAHAWFDYQHVTMPDVTFIVATLSNPKIV